MRNCYVKNAMILSFFMLMSKCIGAIYKVILSNILKTEGIGLYYLIFPLYSFFLIFVTGGMTIFVAQKVSYLRGKNNEYKTMQFVNSCFYISIVLGIVFALILILFSKQFAILQGNENIKFGYIIISLSIIFSAFSSVVKGYFQGNENMIPTSISNVLEQCVKLTFGLILSVFLSKFGVIYAVCGAILGIFASEVIVFVYFLIKFLSTQRHYNFLIFNRKEVKNSFQQFLPISLSNLIMPLSLLVDSFMVVNLLEYSGIGTKASISLYGIATGMVNPLINFPVLFCGTIATAMLPTLSYKIAKNMDVSNMIGGTYCFIWLLCVPCVFGVIALSSNIMQAFFPVVESEYEIISQYYLSVVSINIVWLNISQISTSILNSNSKYRIPLLSQFVGFVFKTITFVCLALFSDLNIISLAVACVVGNAVTCLINLCFVKKYFYVKIASKSIFLPIFNAFLMYFSIFLLNKLIVLNLIIKTILLVMIAVLIYFILCFSFKLITKNDLKILFDSKTKTSKKLKNFS